MRNLSLPKQVKISDNVLFQEIGGECVLLNMESEQYFGLDEVGTRIWELITQDGDTTKILEQLQAEYEVDREILIHDFTNLLENMKKEHLITVQG